MLVGVMVVGKMIRDRGNEQLTKRPHEKRVGAKTTVEKMVVDKMLIDKMS